ncbi:hypothetical protein HTSR_0250 [Halodesulfurarchaeum formicicum]|uniref:PGF-CTERM sorting domain-containing protein n=2 Tax=Halodesulfurarchaeum formicicum TaxID=1873524 RepID=A0A1D8S258_9EURY|nr:hypothetical protein HTSR_0250 [Halodesulfurarchaeum formicicum]
MVDMVTNRSLLVGAVVLVLLVALLPASVAGADLVTLTVAVETPDGDRVSGATVTAEWDDGTATGTTASNGKVLLDVPTNASVELTIEHETYMKNTPLVIEEPGEETVDMTVRPKGNVDVQVADDAGPVEDALVTLKQDGTTVYSERTVDGTLDNGPVEVGTYTLTVRKAGYYQESTTINVTADEPVTESVRLESGSVTLRVNVTDPYFEPPRALEGITVTVVDEGSVNTQSDGAQQLSVPVNTPLTVRFEGEGYETVERSITTGEEDLSLDAEIDRANTLHVTVHATEVVIGQPAFISVTDEYDDPVANATVRLDGEEVTETDSDGRAQILIEDTGEHTIVVEDEDVTSEEKAVFGVTPATTTAETTPTETPTPDTTTATSPGFGPLLALLGLILAMGVGLARRSD